MNAELTPASLNVLFAEASRQQSAGAWDEAESLYLDILHRQPDHADSLNQLGVMAYSLGRYDRAISLIRSALILFPGAAPLYFNCGLAAHQAGRCEDAALLYRRASCLMPDNADMACNLGNVYQSLSRHDEADAVYRQALQKAPQSARIHYNLALALKARGNHEASSAHYRTALTVRPDYADALTNLGSEFLHRGDLAMATNLLRRATKFDRPAAEMQFNLGELHRAQSQFDTAIGCYRASLVVDPTFTDAGAALVFLMRNTGLAGESVKVAWRMTSLRPLQDEMHVGLADSLTALGAITDATNFYRKAIILRPDHAEAFNNLANVQKAQGFLDEAVVSLTRAIACVFDYTAAHSNLLFTQLYRPQTSLPDIFAAATGWNEVHGCPDRPFPHRPGDAERAPRIGFISDDFRTHVVAHLAIPTIETLYRRGHDMTLYSTDADPDEMTARLAASSGRLRKVTDTSDEELRQLVRDDEIDILIDLSGHTAGNRLKALARRLAPVQVTWIGYPATTGVPAMDYFLADHRQVSDDALRYFSESVIRFPDSYLCYQPVTETPDNSHSPFLRNGFVTFGSFNENVKVTRGVIDAWTLILNKLPNSRLLFKSIRFDDPGTRKIYADRLRDAGIDRSRVDFLGRTTPAGHIASIAGADIALDSFPYTGGATTLETLWMGVPVVALPGATMASRHAAGYLGCLGLNDFVARSVDDYVDIAVALAQDEKRLTSLREGLRLRMMLSPLCDRHRFAAAFEAAIDGMWRRHCAGEPPASFDVQAS